MMQLIPKIHESKIIFLLTEKDQLSLSKKVQHYNYLFFAILEAVSIISILSDVLRDNHIKQFKKLFKALNKVKLKKKLKLNNIHIYV